MERFDWDDLRFFLAVARSGRLTAAARRLSADHATVSRRVTALEDSLKAKLFELPLHDLQRSVPSFAEGGQARDLGVLVLIRLLDASAKEDHRGFHRP